MDTTTTSTDSANAELSPFLESVKRIGKQARNWETTTDFGANLDILSPSYRRRIVFSPRMLIVVAAVFGTLWALQTAMIYRELRGQQAKIEQLKSMMTKIMGQQSVRSPSHPQGHH